MHENAWVPVVRAETCDPDILKRAIATYNEMQDIKEKAELAINDPLRGPVRIRFDPAILEPIEDE